MTTFEHAMLGIDGSLATGLHRRYGWQLFAVAGIAAVAPDWDGLTLLVSAQLFDEAHRAWGHNVFACVLLGILIGSIDHRFDLSTRAARQLARWVTLPSVSDGSTTRQQRSLATCLVGIAVAIIACLSQIPADIVVSGTKTLSDWHLKIFWPLSDAQFVYPMVPWGDPGITIVFIAGLFAMLRWHSHTQMIAGLTLAGVVTYIVLRGAL